jgi:hypothetical protein
MVCLSVCYQRVSYMKVLNDFDQICSLLLAPGKVISHNHIGLRSVLLAILMLTMHINMGTADLSRSKATILQIEA